MSIYTVVKHANGDILFELKHEYDQFPAYAELKAGSNINTDSNALAQPPIYVIENRNNDMLVKRITAVKITEVSDLDDFNFEGASIVSWRVGCGFAMGDLTFADLLEDVYRRIGDGSEIIKHSSLKTSTLERNYDGYRYYHYLGISVHHTVPNKEIVNEIVNQCIKNRIHINVKMKLDDMIVELDF
jgi:hypothetical protein